MTPDPAPVQTPDVELCKRVIRTLYRMVDRHKASDMDAREFCTRMLRTKALREAARILEKP